MEKTKRLLFSLTAKDFRFDFFAAATKGGQHAQKAHTNCRCVHEESGATGISCDERSQSANKELAFLRCVNSDKFKYWHNRKCAKILKIEEEYRNFVSGNRSDKIRTYNYKRNEVVNHISGNSFNLDEILNGRLDEILEDSRRVLLNSDR